MGHRPPPLLRLTRLLPPVPRARPVLLQRCAPPESYHLVLRYRSDPELLPQRPLRPQLEIPLVKQARPHMGHRPPCPRLLRRRLGPRPLALRSRLPLPQLDPPHLRHRPRRTPLGTDAPRHVRHGRVGALGHHPSRRRARWPLIVVVARRAGCAAGGRLRHDPSADADALPHRVYARVRAGPGQCRDYRGTGDGAG